MEYRASESRLMIAFTTISGLVYCIVGILQIFVAVTQLEIPLIPNNLITGAILVIIASVFLTGTIHYMRRYKDAYAYLMVGMVLAGLVFVLHIVTLLTNSVGWLLMLEDWLDWSINQEIVPALWVYPILGLGFVLLKEIEKRKEDDE